MRDTATEMVDPINPSLHKAVKDLYDNAVREFKEDGNDLNSPAFLEKFPNFSYIGMFAHSEEDRTEAQRILDAAFATEFEARTDESLKVYFSNTTGGTREDNFCEMVDDFLNYTIPRTAGLHDADKLFDEQYGAFERSLYMDSFQFTVCSFLQHASDDHGFVRDTSGVRLNYYSQLPPAALVNTAPLRNRIASYCEIAEAARLRQGRKEGELPFFLFVMEFTEKVKKDQKALKRIRERVDEITNKVVFGLRLITHAATYSHYRGFRMPGGMASHRFQMFDYPNEVIDYSSNSGSMGTGGEFLRRLMPDLLTCPYSRIAVVDHKIEDALRRMSRTVRHDPETQLKAEIDILLDYIQALESIIRAKGSYNIALHAAVLLKANKPRASIRAGDIFDFLRGMYSLRNQIMHGNLAKVLNGEMRPTQSLGIHQFRTYVYDLAILQVLNDDLNGLAHKLALGESAALKTIYY